MKQQAHLPAFSIGTPERRATIAGGIFVGALLLILAVQSGAFVNNPLLDRFGASPNPDHRLSPQISSRNRVSLNVHSPADAASPWSGFSVAHTPPPNVALSQRYSVGATARVAFEAFGERALRKMQVSERMNRPSGLRHDRMLLMLMLLRLRDSRRG